MAGNRMDITPLFQDAGKGTAFLLFTESQHTVLPNS